MTKSSGPGPCPFLGNRDHVPAGPAGEDLETLELETTAGIIPLRPGQPIKTDHAWTVLRKIRRCGNGEIYGMVEYPDGGLLWTQLVPAPVPELTEWQKAEVERIKQAIPRQFWVLGDMSHNIGDRTSFITPEGSKSGTIVFMAAMRPFTAGAVVVLDDGSMTIGDDVAALMDGRIQVESHESRIR